MILTHEPPKTHSVLIAYTGWDATTYCENPFTYTKNN